MADEYIRKCDVVGAVPKERIVEYMDEFGAGYNSCRNDMLRSIESIEPADVVPYSIAPDGTVTITVPKGTKRIGRILIEEDGTQYGGLFYPDTGGCFLSSMERSEQDGQKDNHRCIKALCG